MLIDTLLLYLTPIAIRVGLAVETSATTDWWWIALSLLPLLIVLPSIWLPQWISDEEQEHTVRHAVYALGFCVSAATGVRWDVVLSSGSMAWTAWPLVAYVVVGAVSLWWFCLSHILENRSLMPLYTHSGDVAVLPLTLVGIATFAHDVPDEVFTFSRSVIFYVPVVVAWATLMFIAYNGFAISTTTTHSTSGFQFYAKCGIVIAIAQLSLLEARAPPLAFQFFPLVAAFLCQLTPRACDAPVLRPHSWTGTTVVAAATGTLVGLTMSLRFPSGLSYGCGIIGCVIVTKSVRPIAGARWVTPATGYATLVTAVVLARNGQGTVLRPVDVAALGAIYYVALTLVSYVAPATFHPNPPHASPPEDVGATPQAAASCFALSKLQRLFQCDICPSRTRYDDVTVQRFFDKVNPSCPAEFVGVWWMDGNSFPMDLICVHNLQWKKYSSDGRRAPTAYMCNGRHTTFRSTLAGSLLHLASWLTVTQLTVWPQDPRWIRTDAWKIPGLRLVACTYWLCRIGDDEMLRLVYDSEGRVVWQYRMRRIARTANTRTRFYTDFLRACRDIPYRIVH